MSKRKIIYNATIIRVSLHNRRTNSMTNKDIFDETFPDDKQVGGSHYKSFFIQPWTFIRKNGLNPFQANVIKYVCRYLFKGKSIEA